MAKAAIVKPAVKAVQPAAKAALATKPGRKSIAPPIEPIEEEVAEEEETGELDIYTPLVEAVKAADPSFTDQAADESDQAYIKRLLEGSAKVDNDTFNELGEETEDWYNAAAEQMEKEIDMDEPEGFENRVQLPAAPAAKAGRRQLGNGAAKAAPAAAAPAAEAAPAKAERGAGLKAWREQQAKAKAEGKVLPAKAAKPAKVAKAPKVKPVKEPKAPGRTELIRNFVIDNRDCSADDVVAMLDEVADPAVPGKTLADSTLASTVNINMQWTRKIMQYLDDNGYLAAAE
jgi:hypothetical protein